MNNLVDSAAAEFRREVGFAGRVTHVCKTLRGLARIWDGTPHGDQLRYLALLLESEDNLTAEQLGVTPEEVEDLLREEQL